MSEVKKVQIRNGFSDRNKIQPLNTEIQLHDFDKRTRNALANLIQKWYLFVYFQNSRENFCQLLVKEAYGEYLSDSIKHMIKYDNENFFELYIHKTISLADYSEVLTLTEFITNIFVGWKDDILKNPFKYSPYGSFAGYNNSNFPNYVDELNDLFETEFVGYRFIGGKITPISDENEVKSIQETLLVVNEGAKEHIQKALSFLSDRDNPDYKNSIKESISAVESVCQIITGDDKATLGEALKKLEGKGLHLHTAMRKAFSALYGYTSDQGGIRHAEGMFASDVSFEEAKYMLVSCCAFVNFLIAEEAKHE